MSRDSTHLEKSRKQSGFFNPVCYVVELQDGEEVAQAGGKANGIKGVCKGIYKKKPLDTTFTRNIPINQLGLGLMSNVCVCTNSFTDET